ncbi:helicase C-terminal domain-containing protein [Rhizomicrobium electricum]|uniref:ATP-dependent DNA helicase n=1 Tax=Rhizomicrobium electricum TaxID=480070 RepID=A0ABN1FAY8_9PROT|nr:ATP-dependent DNA helicase DinG [Rhizomicrobium electricum]
MNDPRINPPDLSLLLALPALVPAGTGAVVDGGDHGRLRPIGAAEAAALLADGNVLVANAAFVAGRLKAAPSRLCYDVLELFAFVRPGTPCVPSALGIAQVLGVAVADQTGAGALRESARLLLEELPTLPAKTLSVLRPLCQTMAKAGWRWAGPILDIIEPSELQRAPLAGFEVWRTLSEWEDAPAPGKPSSLPVTPEEARARLASLVGNTGEERPEQRAYTDAAAFAFSPRERAGAPRVALVEAGTGIGKTLGYLAPASLWAEKNGPGLWISTYTRNLQRQIVAECSRLYPDPAEREDKVVARKGRENYLCLLNFEEAVKRQALAPSHRTIALALISRWVAATADGDISGSGFPAFLAAYLPLREITDRRGECIYAACPHYRVCFIEKIVRRAKNAQIVVANHALVIANAAQDWLGTDETTDNGGERRTRYVFDEGHHLFDAADSGFAAAVSGTEMADMRRWVRGPEGRTRSRSRGLEERLKDLVEDNEDARRALEEAVAAASVLAGEGWTSRLGSPHGPGEVFLAAVYQHVRARCEDRDQFYSLECETMPLTDEMIEAAQQLGKGLKRLAVPLMRLAKALRQHLDDKSSELEPYQRARIDAAARGLEWRGRIILPAWMSMLEALETGEINDDFVDWFEITREDGRGTDIGLERRWVDPTVPLTNEVLARAHGALVTSATLRDAGNEDDWQSAEVRTGAAHLPEPARRASFGSPFAYAEQSRVFIVRDVERRNPDQMAAAFRELFLAAGGGALGLFTAVRALKSVETKIAGPLAEAGLTLYAQHVDRLDTGALVDLFRSEENSCLLGTDALRDGVDVPGRSLRLVVFDKVPWPKPTILHKARRARFGRSYDDLLTRLRLKQAFGRLIRGQNDKGCFVILESATPSRLLAAFPPETPVLRCGLAEAVREIRGFLGTGLLPPSA